MDTKLTLMLDKRIIGRAKAYAKRNHKSLSGLVENYFKNLTEAQKADDGASTPLVNELTGVLKLKPDFDFKKDRLRHLEDRHQ
ncbi:MAG: hypothetical protein JWO30_1943 [Fibrobacteres bacterium]|nr:hypothetical protein [Fibrobacterota bacterium]